MPIERIDERQDRERAKAVELAVGQIEKQFGKGSIMRLGQKDVIAQMPSISTTCSSRSPTTASRRSRSSKSSSAPAVST